MNKYTYRSFCVPTLLLALVCTRPSAGEEVVLIKIPNALQIFGLSPSPKGYTALAFARREDDPGEYREGKAVLLRLGAHPVVVSLNVPESLDDPQASAWMPDGQIAYFVTKEGIEKLESTSGALTREISGVFSGIALSHSGSLLATWNWEYPERKPGECKLTVFDVNSKRELRSWVLPVAYASDQYGHELVFLNDGTAVLAKTYDAPDSTPLRLFNIATGEVRLVSSSALSLIAVGNDAYFIESRNSRISLLKLAAGSNIPAIEASDFPFDSLGATADPRVMVAANSRTKDRALFQTSTREISRLGPGCDGAIPFADGRIVFVRGNELIDSSSRCGARTDRGGVD